MSKEKYLARLRAEHKQLKQEAKEIQRKQQHRKDKFQKEYSAQSKESVLRQYGTDPAVSMAAGMLKIPSDIGNFIAPNNNISEYWESNINNARDSMQTDSLVQGRKNLEHIVANNKGQLTKEFWTEVGKNPRVAMNYLAELGIKPTAIPKMLKQAGISGKEIHKLGLDGIVDKVAGTSKVMSIFASPVNDINDARELHKRNADNLNRASNEFLSQANKSFTPMSPEEKIKDAIRAKDRINNRRYFDLQDSRLKRGSHIQHDRDNYIIPNLYQELRIGRAQRELQPTRPNSILEGTVWDRQVGKGHELRQQIYDELENRRKRGF